MPNKTAERTWALPLLVAVALAVFASAAYADGDAQRGEKIYKKNCFACHRIGEGAKSLVGPVLNDLFGRTAATYDGYKYSDAMIAARERGLVWKAETLRDYLPRPRDYIPNTKMTFVGLKKPQDIEDLIAYLQQFSPHHDPAE